MVTFKGSDTMNDMKSKCRGHNIWFPIKNQALCVFCSYCVCDLCQAMPLVAAPFIGCQQLKLSKRKLIWVRFVVCVNVIVSTVSNLHCGHIGDQVVTMTMQIA